MLNDTLSNAMSKIMNSQKAGKDSCEIRPSSKTILGVLEIMSSNGYIGEVNINKESKGARINVKLIGTVNKCGSIKPRFPVKKNSFEKFEKTFLPAKDFGILIVSTQKGILSHKDAKSKGFGGRLLAYCY